MNGCQTVGSTAESFPAGSSPRADAGVDEPVTRGEQPGSFG